MTVYHIVLLKLKPNTSAEKIAEFKATGEAMMGVVPGLQKFDFGPPVASTAHRAKGYDLGLVAVLGNPEDLPVYAGHPAHLKVQAYREELCEDTLAYDLEF